MMVYLDFNTTMIYCITYGVFGHLTRGATASNGPSILAKHFEFMRVGKKYKKRPKNPDITANFGRHLPCLCKKPWLHLDLCEWLWLVVAFSWSARRPCCPQRGHHHPRCPPQRTEPQRGHHHQTTRPSHCSSRRWTWRNAFGPPLVAPSIAIVFLLGPGPVQLAWK